MDSNQIFMILAVVGALSASMIAIPVMAQNMTGENMTGKISGGFDFHGQQMAKCIPPEVKVDPFTCGIPRGSGEGRPGELGQGMLGQTAAECTPPEVEVSEGKCGVPQGGGSADSAAATAADDDDGGDTDTGNGGDTDSGDGGEGQDGGQGEDNEEEQEGGN
jgi:hypothetical protein